MMRLLSAVLLVSACYAQPQTRLEFEAASVKPAPPFDGGSITMRCWGGPGSTDPGLFRCENFSLSNLLNWAFELGANDLSAPDWAQAALFNLDARVPEGTTHDQFRQMFQNLLTDRFKLVVHREKRESLAYRLVIAKGGPKFQAAAEVQPEEPKADAAATPPAPKPLQPDADGYPAFEPGKGGMAAINGRSRMAEPRATMAWLASQLSGYLHSQVVDATGLTGRYAIDLRWVMDDGPSAAADDTPGPTLGEAVQKQLGLQLQRTSNGTKSVLVVDHAEKIPAGN
ncbi:MAG TPA: TIGR03435 family protein [Bryobacteraceae bacterium]|nr:TIGR03435 family protein [Bryobacteraceae bacterium]